MQGLFVVALACCCLLSDVSGAPAPAPAPAPIIDPLSATIGAAGDLYWSSLKDKMIEISTSQAFQFQVG